MCTFTATAVFGGKDDGVNEMDPQDITDWKPTPATWEGTVIVRKENSAPLHRWDGEKVVRTTTRDKYKTKAYKDEDAEVVEGIFDGYYMVGADQKKYPVPMNYSSKSKLIP